MAIDKRRDGGLDLPRTDDGLPSGAIAGGGIGGAGMDTSGNAPNVSVGSRLEESDLGVRPGAGRVDQAGSMSSGSGMSGMAGGTGGMGSAAMAGGTTAGSYGASGAAMGSGGLSSSTLERDATMSHTSNAADGDMSENRLIAADRVVGTAVYDSDGNRIGSIDNLMIDKITGEVAYAVMSFGGFLGIGERYHPLPWDVLTYDTKLGGYNVGMAADNLRDAPNYDRTELSTFHDNDYGSRVDNYYSGRMQSRDHGMTSGATRFPPD